MKQKSDRPKTQTQKSSPEEVQEWLDSVHFGSCCSDPINPEAHKTCKTKEDKQKK